MQRLKAEVEGRGMSMTKIKKYIKAKGIALGNAKVSGL